jgi:signal transduction histidine kinase
VALNAVVQEAVELLAYALRIDNIEVALQLGPELPTLGANPHQVHQVVVNLITNAHQALREVPPPRRLTLTTRDDPARRRVVLEVVDTGPGIPRELQERIFEPFFTTKPPGIGTGLGLPLCRGIIEGHGGTIHITCRANQAEARCFWSNYRSRPSPARCRHPRHGSAACQGAGAYDFGRG